MNFDEIDRKKDELQKKIKEKSYERKDFLCM